MTLWSCKDHEPSKAESPQAREDATSRKDAALLTIVLDGETVARVSPSELQQRVRLIDRLPEDKRDLGSWQAVDALAADGRRLNIPNPGDRYGGHTPYLYLDGAGTASLGWYLDSAEDGRRKPSPRLKLVSAAEIRIRTTSVQPGTEGSLSVRVGGAATSVQLSWAEIQALSKHTPASSEKGSPARRMRGWKLRDVVGLVVTPESLVSVVVRNDASQERRFAAAELHADEGAAVVIKRNQRGLVMVRWLDAAGERQEIRAVTGLDVQTSTP